MLQMIEESEYKKYLDYIEKYWGKITFNLPRDKGAQIALPNSFVSPNRDIFKKDQYYWDSYFIILGLLESGRIELAKGMVDNFIYLFNKFNIIPSRNRLYNIGISQMPFLTSMILEIFEKDGDKVWLKKTTTVVEKELNDYWMNDKRTENHLVHKGLSRYCDHNITDATAEHESGWDMTSRFKDSCLDFLPVDLNSCLYKYEIDLVKINRILGKRSKVKKYTKQAERRKKMMIKLMWDEKLGFFFDYDYVKGKREKFHSLAGFYPLWVELATVKQAEKTRENLKRFENKGGLANTQKNGLSKEFRQWDYPNGWANEHWIVIKGLKNYGFYEDSERIAKKWLDLNAKVYDKTKKFWEKYNVVTCEIGREGRYPNQTGFGWTNSIFIKLIKEFKN